MSVLHTYTRKLQKVSLKIKLLNPVWDTRRPTLNWPIYKKDTRDKQFK